MAIVWQVGVGGCGKSMPPARVACGTCEEEGRFVRIQRYSLEAGTGDPSGYDHPFHLSGEDWGPILETIQVQKLGATFALFPRDLGEVSPAFTPEQVEYLAETLPRAFALAGPQDWVVFALGAPQSGTLTKVTTGAWYVREPLLYFVLVNHEAAVTMPIIRERLDADPLYDVSGSPSFLLLPGEFLQEVDTPRSLLGYFRSDPPTIAIQYRGVLHEPERPSPPASSIEQRLQTLKGLRERGLITEEDYERKKKELLDLL